MSLSKRFLGPNQASLWLLEKLICQNYFQFRILFGILIFGWDLKTDKTACLRINALILNIEKTFVRSYITKNLFLLRSLNSMQRIFDKGWNWNFISYPENINFWKALHPIDFRNLTNGALGLFSTNSFTATHMSHLQG